MRMSRDALFLIEGVFACPFSFLTGFFGVGLCLGASIYPSTPIREIEVFSIMFRRNELKKTVLQCVQNMGAATSRGISERLKRLAVSPKNVSMTLLNCKRQRLVERMLVKRGRVREFSYALTERGRERLEYYECKEEEAINGMTGYELKEREPGQGMADYEPMGKKPELKEREATYRMIDVDRIVKDAKDKVEPLLTSALVIFESAKYVCDNTWRSTVFSAAKDCAILSAYPVHCREELVSAFASKKLLNIVNPTISVAIEQATKKMLHSDFMYTAELIHIDSSLNSLSPPTFGRVNMDFPFKLLVCRRMNELNLGQWVLYNMLNDEREEKEKYKRLYESEKSVPKAQSSSKNIRIREVSSPRSGQESDWKLKLGIAIGEYRQALQFQTMLSKTLYKKMSGGFRPRKSERAHYSQIS